MIEVERQADEAQIGLEAGRKRGEQDAEMARQPDRLIAYEEIADIHSCAHFAA
jgi:hypothetical protein